MDKKTCKECDKEKDISEFPKNGKYVRNFCHRCYYRRSRESQKRAYKKKSSKTGFQEKQKERLRNWRKKNPFYDLGRLAKRFGYTKEQFSLLYNLLWERQQGKCAACKIELVKHGKGTNVDHNHVTMQVRGLLCNKCNLGIGLLQDSAEVCSAAAEYLRMSKADK